MAKFSQMKADMTAFVRQAIVDRLRAVGRGGIFAGAEVTPVDATSFYLRLPAVEENPDRRHARRFLVKLSEPI
jgi:hypothetical protein